MAWPRSGCFLQMGSPFKDIVFCLFLESRDDTTPEATFLETLLSAAIKTMQPAPALAHVEMFLVDCNGDPHFATYLGHRAGWGFSFGSNQKSFYCDVNAGLWRAVPVRAKNAAALLRAELGWHVNTPYSLGRYCCSVPPMRSLAALLPDGVGAPAHCAGLTARCLQRAMKSESPVLHAPPWYGPSTLYIELTHASASKATTPGAVDDSTAAAVGRLTAGCSETVKEMQKSERDTAILHLSNRASMAACSGDAVEIRVAQKQLDPARLRSLYG